MVWLGQACGEGEIADLRSLLGQAQTLKIKKMLSFGEIMKMKNMLSFWSGLGRHAGRERLQI